MARSNMAARAAGRKAVNSHSKKPAPERAAPIDPAILSFSQEELDSFNRTNAAHAKHGKRPWEPAEFLAFDRYAQANLRLVTLQDEVNRLYGEVHGKKAADDLGCLRMEPWEAMCRLMDKHERALARRFR